jgi:hypothetical protein
MNYIDYEVIVNCTRSIEADGETIYKIILGTFRDGETTTSWSENDLRNALCTLQVKIPEGERNIKGWEFHLWSCGIRNVWKAGKPHEISEPSELQVATGIYKEQRGDNWDLAT